MEAGGGMVAVVQGLGAGLAVTLMDGCRRYTLMPNETGPCTNHTCAPAPHAKPQLHAQQSVNCASQYTAQECQPAPARSLRENSVQATDGRYASTYKTMHCNVSPTSPPQAVTEFPPQRTEVVRGQGNFVIGGTGSGATCSPAVRSTSFRGGMCWPDRGSVCASRPSVKSDAFASSLRKYPNMSPERSTEIVERLISYTQAKHLSKNQQRHSASPTRNSAHSISSRQTFVVDRNSTKQSETDKLFDQDVMIIKKIGPNEREKERRGERVSQDENGSSWNRFLSCRNNEVRCFRDTNRTVNQEFRNFSSPASGQFSKPSSPRIAQNECHLGQRPTLDRESDKSVDMEIQAATKMESKEILTLPRIVPMQRTVGTSLTPMPSKMEAKLQDESKSRRSSSTELAHNSKAIQVNARITSSSEELRHNIHANTRSKRSKSKEELGNRDVPHDIKKIYGLKDMDNYFKFNNNQLQNKEPLLKQKRICENCKHLFEEFETLRKSVSDNTYLRENLYFEMNPDETNKDLKYILRHYERKANNLMNKSKCKRFSSPDCVNKFDFSQSESSDNARTLSRYSETENENGISDALKDISIRDKYDHHSNDTMDKFVERKRWQKESHCDLSRNDEDYYSENYDDTPVVMTQNELRNLIDLDILAFTEKYRLNITTECLNILIEEIFDLFVMNLKCNISPNKDYIANNIKHILQKRGLSEFHSVYLSNILAVHWEEEFLANNKLEVNPSKIISETLIVLSNITQNIQPDYNFSNNKKNENTLSINEISQIDTNVDAYVTQISNEIDEWLTNLKIPQSQDKDLRQKVMNDLANEIMDRHKYLAMKETNEVSSSSELEYLKYQIFKWIHKLVCDADMTPVEHASDLMKRIQTIPVPMFSLQRRGLSTTTNRSGHKEELDSSSNHRMNVIEPSNLGASTSRRSVTFQCCKRATCKRNLNKTAPVKPSSNRKNSLEETPSTQGIENTRRKSSPDRVDSTNTEFNKENSKTSQSLREQSNTQTSLPQTRSISATKNNMPYDSRGYFSGGITIKDDEDVTSKGTVELPHVAKAPFTPCNINKINEDYVQYLNEWVKEIPIPVSNCAEQTLADKTRMDICNQIWAVVSRLRTVPETFNNRFLFEDMLEEEIEKILSNVTPSEELNAKKYILKARIIEKTGDANELMKSCCAISYKHQLINGINDNLPKFNNSGNNYTSILNIYEELQILNIVENFIIYLNYQNEDKVLAEAYKNKLVKCTEEFVEKLKENYSKELNDINTTLYRNDILDALKNVPVPSEKTLQEEVNDILLSLEIDKWLSDLPLTQNDDVFEQLQRKRLRNNLAKQIRDIEKKSGENDGSFDNSLKQEVSQFLGKISLPEGESLHINSMVEDLIERLKTRPKTNEYDNKKVAFNEPDYDEFSKNMPFSSTFSEKYNINSKKQTNAPKDLVSDQSFNRHYHNISKPLLDDLRLDRNDKATPSMQQIPNIKTSNQYRIPSSSLKSSLEPQWHTIEESKHEFPQSCNLNDRNRSEINEMVREIDPNQQSGSRHYHDIAKPLLDDMQEINPKSNDAYKSIEKIPAIGTSKNSQSRRFSFDSNAEPHWYTLYKSRHESNNPEMLSENFVHSSPRKSDENPHSRARQFDNEFVVPQKYFDKADSKDYRTQRQPVDYPNNSPKRVDEDSSSLSDRQNVDNRRRTSYPTQDPKWAPSRIPYATSLKRHDSPKFTQQKMMPDNFNSFNETPFHSTFQDEANRHFTNRSGFEDTNDNRHNRSPEYNRSDEFYKSTDQEGIRKIIERNKSLEANLDRSGPANDRSGFYQQSYSQGPPDYRCYRDRRDDEKTYMRDSFHEQYREDESENDDEDDIRCRCVKKVLKSKRRPRFCPLDQYDGYPMCVRSPYFYPYFYY